MAREGVQRSLRSISRGNNGFRKIFNEEFSVFKTALQLKKLDFSIYRPRIAVTVIYSLIQTTLVSIIALAISFIKGNSNVNLIFYPISFALILIYSYGAGYFYKVCFDSRKDYTFCMHVYMCMYSVLYLPIFTTLQAINRIISWIFFLAFWILFEYALCINYRDIILDSNDPQRSNFLLTLSAFITQGIFVALYSYILGHFFTCFLVRSQ